VGDAEFFEEVSAAGVFAEVVLAVDGLGVVVDEPAVDAGFGGDFGVGFVLEEKFFDELSAAARGLDEVEGLGDSTAPFDELRAGKLFGKVVAVGAVFLAAEVGDNRLDAVHGHGELAGDLAVGAAFEDEVEDGHAARGGGCGEFAVAGAFAFFFVPLGFLDFVAKKQAAGEEGDDEVPGAIVGAGGGGDLVAASAGEGGWRRVEAVEVGGGLEGAGVEEMRADRNVRPTADSNVCPTGRTSNIQHRTFNVQRTLTPALSRRGGSSTRRTTRLSSPKSGRGGRRGVFEEVVEEGARGEGIEDGAGGFFAGGAEPAPAAEAEITMAFGCAVGGEGEVVGAEDDGLFEFVGDSVGEEFPERAPEGIGALVEGWAGRVEGFPGVDDGDAVAAVFAAEAFDEFFGV
jgi:hypothetical protein